MSLQEQAAVAALDRLKQADSAQVRATVARKHELNFQHGEPSLVRTTTDHALHLAAIRAQRRADLGLNQLHREAIELAASELLSFTEAAVPDPAFAIAPASSPKSFESGPAESDLPLMRERLSEFLASVKTRWPRIILDEGSLAHNRGDTVFANSNGARWRARQGYYSFGVMFSARDGRKMSSFNYVMGELRSLERPLTESFGLAELLTQNAGQVDAASVRGKFEGSVLITPHCLRDFLEAFLGYLSDSPLVAGISVLKGRLGERVASPLLNLTADPRAPELSQPEFFDADGFEAEPMALLEKGVLRSYLLSLYGANKTGLPRGRNSGSRYALAAGELSRGSMIAGMKKGVALARFSGGRPAPNGDFSGVAKNSYLVENGEVRHALTETMVSGNLLRLFESVSAVSRETLDFGNQRLPWLLASGVTISGKA